MTRSLWRIDGLRSLAMRRKVRPNRQLSVRTKPSLAIRVNYRMTILQSIRSLKLKLRRKKLAKKNLNKFQKSEKCRNLRRNFTSNAPLHT